MHEFEKKLRKAGALRKFKRNLKKHTNATWTFERHLEMTGEGDFPSFICTAFIWEDTPDGFEYWSNIANM